MRVGLRVNIDFNRKGLCLISVGTTGIRSLVLAKEVAVTEVVFGGQVSCMVGRVGVVEKDACRSGFR